MQAAFMENLPILSILSFQGDRICTEIKRISHISPQFIPTQLTLLPTIYMLLSLLRRMEFCNGLGVCWLEIL